MADNLDAPGLTSPAIDTRVDITDHYAFQKPGDPGRTVLIMNLNPLAPTHADEFRSDAAYETLLDTDVDAIPNIAFRYRFTPKSGGKQFAVGDDRVRPEADRRARHERLLVPVEVSVFDLSVQTTESAVPA